MKTITIQELASKLGKPVDLIREIMNHEPIQLVDEQDLEPQDELAVWIAPIPGVYLTGYMLAIAMNRKHATQLINERRKIEIADSISEKDVPETELKRIPIITNTAFLIWNGDY